MAVETERVIGVKHSVLLLSNNWSQYWADKKQNEKALRGDSNTVAADPLPVYAGWPTNTPTNKQTGPITIDCAAASVQCNDEFLHLRFYSNRLMFHFRIWAE